MGTLAHSRSFRRRHPEWHAARPRAHRIPLLRNDSCEERGVTVLCRVRHDHHAGMTNADLNLQTVFNSMEFPVDM